MENKKIIIGLVGKMSCGKGTVAEYLEKNYGAVTYRFSSILRDILNRVHQDITRHNMQTLSTVMRENFGEDLLASVIAKDVEKEENNIVIVDGVRRMADIKYLSKMDNFKLVKIEAEQKLRYERILKRTENEGDSGKSFEEFQADELKEADAEIPVVMEKADIALNNDGDFEALYKQVESIVE